MADWKQERDKCNKFYTSFVEDDVNWFDKVKSDWIKNNPNATPEEAFTQGYLLSEEHPLSKTIHNIINFVEDFYPWKHLKSESSMKSIFNIFRNKDIEFKNKIEIPDYK